MDWTEIDEWIFKGGYIRAIRDYRELHQSSLNEALEAVSLRTEHLRQHVPEKFPAHVSPRTEAFEKLAGITQPVAAIEALWDGDTFRDWFICIYAMVEETTESSTWYAERYLTAVYLSTPRKDGLNESFENYSQRLVSDLAAQANAQAYQATSSKGENGPRWRESVPKLT
ncbi:hypothetical protein [Deinococcus sp.]|uniref:hypothetical protein n=1 Tax=Deinococcus sp. TaxID=47478 RepID=UPI0025F514D4|nr:hypothetical protein [Deinococcus sp.]